MEGEGRGGGEEGGGRAGEKLRLVEEQAEHGRAEARAEARAGQEERDKRWQALLEERCDMWRYLHCQTVGAGVRASG